MDSFASYNTRNQVRRRAASVTARSSLSSGADPSLARSRRQMSMSQQPRRLTVRDLWERAPEEDRLLFTQCVRRVQCRLKESLSSMNFLRELASYYTRTAPLINGFPFCVSLSYATFLFHMQMPHVCIEDIQRYAQLIATAIDIIPDTQRSEHPFVRDVIRGDVFGLSSPSLEGPAHYVVLVPSLQYRAFSLLAVTLVEHGVVPVDIINQWQRKLRELCRATSSLVSNRALTLILKTAEEVDREEQVEVLMNVIRSSPRRMHVEQIVACYERLKRAAPCISTGPMYGRSLSIRLTSVFLTLRSPIRKEFVESFLYPSLCSEDVKDTLNQPAVRMHLYRKLLRLCTPGMGTSNPYYLCICAIIQPFLDDVTEGSLEIVSLVKCLMPHAAYFVATLTLDTRLQAEVLAGIVVSLVGSCARVMKRVLMNSPVARAVESPATVYSILFLLREVVRGCSISSSERATLMLQCIGAVANPSVMKTLGKVTKEAFEKFLPSGGDTCNSLVGGGAFPYIVDPQLLCAEMDMVLHGRHVCEAIDIILQHNWNIGSICALCGETRGQSPLCQASGAAHYVGTASLGRVLVTITECAGSEVVREKLKSLMCDSSRRLDSAVHLLLFHIFAHAGPHRKELYLEIEPYIRSTLVEVLNKSRAFGVLDSEERASLLTLHAKLVILLGNAVDRSHVDALLQALSCIQIHSNHDALVLWYLANLLLRRGGSNVDLLPTAPDENNYCVEYPDCAPTCKEAADNAQLLLKIIHRAHYFSPQMRKLVGCCVCKLIQDFNMQADNIITALLSPFGSVPVSLNSLVEYALPVGANSTFWSFFLRQMKTSAPARTALLASFVKSVTRRFSVASPVSCMPITGEETTAELFAVMAYETVRRCPPLARVVLHLLTSWVKQTRSTPGRFVSLVYTSLQMVVVIFRRSVGADVAEVGAETRQDAHHFGEAVSKAVQEIKMQVGRINDMAREIRDENVVFFRLLVRLLKRTKFVVKETVGESCDEIADMLGAGDSLDNEEEEGAGVSVEVCDVAQPDGTPYQGGELFSYSLEELQRPSDDNVFDDLTMSHGDFDAVPAPIPLHLQRRNEQKVEVTLTRRPHANTTFSSQLQDTVTSSADSLSPCSSGGSCGLPPAFDSGTGAADASGRKQGGITPLSKAQERLNESYRQAEGAETILTGRAPTVSKGIQTSPQEGQVKRINPATSPNGQLSNVAASAFPEAVLVESNPGRSKRFSEMLKEASTAIGDIGANSTWHEMSVFSEGDEEPIDDTTVPPLQGTNSANCVTVPSALALQFFATYQTAGDVFDELQRQDERRHYGECAGPPARRQVLATEGERRGDLAVYGFDRGTASQHNLVSTAAVAPHAAILPVVVEGRANNYDLPHSSRPQVPGRLVVAHVNMVNTVDRKRAQDGGEAEGSACRMTAEKKNRVEGAGAGNPGQLVTYSPQPEQGQNGGHHDDAKQCYENRGATTTLLPQQETSAALRELEALLGHSGATSVSPTFGGEVATTTSGGVAMFPQGVVPRFFVEQGTGTTTLELRQAMGARDPNGVSSLTNNERRVRGNGIMGANVDGEVGNTWRSDVTAPPVPEYARDPQYSLEIV
ncbi:kinetoplastid kinetochore protein 1 [Trypanosoma equiperdum]|uniref:Kinetoplastid kinetochore protein 1 n=1 Tax=Trypanosoma equiperdum TaxID=5694 RepID=A0A1G4IKY9_TRYEQ|nr:kinetoplastid kinetochore protein 1 [Trypanosoma equiperdum]